MDQYGNRLMVIELAVLGLTTFAAMGTDRFWSGAAIDGDDVSRGRQRLR